MSTYSYSYQPPKHGSYGFSVPKETGTRPSNPENASRYENRKPSPKDLSPFFPQIANTQTSSNKPFTASREMPSLPVAPKPIRAANRPAFFEDIGVSRRRHNLDGSHDYNSPTAPSHHYSSARYVATGAPVILAPLLMHAKQSTDNLPSASQPVSSKKAPVAGMASPRRSSASLTALPPLSGTLHEHSNAAAEPAQTKTIKRGPWTYPEPEVTKAKTELSDTENGSAEADKLEDDFNFIPIRLDRDPNFARQWAAYKDNPNIAEQRIYNARAAVKALMENSATAKLEVGKTKEKRILSYAPILHDFFTPDGNHPFITDPDDSGYTSD